MLMKFRICHLSVEVNSNFPFHFCKEVSHKQVSHREGGQCEAPFVHSRGDLSAACRIVTEYRLGPPVFPYPWVNVLAESCYTFQLSGRGSRGVGYDLVVSLCGAVALKHRGTNNGSTPLRCHGAASASLPSLPCPRSPSYFSVSLGWCSPFYTRPGPAMSPTTNILPAVTQPQYRQG